MLLEQLIDNESSRFIGKTPCFCPEKEMKTQTNSIGLHEKRRGSAMSQSLRPPMLPSAPEYLGASERDESG